MHIVPAFLRYMFFVCLSVLLTDSVHAQCVAWDYVDVPGISVGAGRSPVMELSSSNIPFLAYSDSAYGEQPVVKFYDGTTWINVGVSSTIGTESSRIVGLIFAADGQPIVFYNTSAGVGVGKKYNGTGWDAILGIGSEIDAVKVGRDDKLYLLTDGTVMRYDWTSWTTVSTTVFDLFWPPEPSTVYDIAADSSGNVYVAYNGLYDGGTEQYPYIRKFNGSTWSLFYHLESYESRYYISVDVASDNSVIFTYPFMYGGNFVGSRNEILGNHYSTLGSYQLPGEKFALSPNAKGYMLFTDLDYSRHGTVANSSAPLNGTHGWSFFGGRGFTEATHDYDLGDNYIAVGSDEVPYIAFRDNAHGNKISVMKKVAAMPAISGDSLLCRMQSYQMQNVMANGTWTSSNSAVAIDSVSGIVYAASAGTSVVSYTSGSCTVARVVSVNTVAGYISGDSVVCEGGSATLMDTATGGTWTSDFPGLASIGGSTGVLTGVTAGTVRISYSNGGCAINTVVTVQSVDAPAISGELFSDDAMITAFAGVGSSGYSGDGGAAISAQLYRPRKLFRSHDNNIYFSDYANARIRKIDTNGIISTVAGTGTLGFSGDGGPATSAMIQYAEQIAEDTYGNIYIADGVSNRVRKINTSGIISTVAGTGAAGYSGDGGPATAAMLARPTGLVIDGVNNIYVADMNNSRIRKIDTSGAITTIAGDGGSGYTGDNVSATASSLKKPSFLYLDGLNNLFVADRENNRIRRIDKFTGIITTVAGDGSTSATGENVQATATGIYQPNGFAMDRTGNLYIADWLGNKIRKVNTAGTITTLAGTGTSGYSGDGSSATAAKFWHPLDICFDRAGNILVADYENHAIRKILVDRRVGGDVINVCVGSNLQMEASEPGGAWSSSNSSIATVGSTGVITGVAVGTALVSYSATNSCGTRVSIDTVHVGATLVAGVISGVLDVPALSVITLSSSGVGGVWSSSNPSVAVAGSATGVVSGVAIGTANITYSVSGTCGTGVASVQVTVNNSSPDCKSWKSIGGPGFSEGEVQAVDVAVGSDGTPYVSFADAANAWKLSVMKFDGSNWVYVGSAGLTATALIDDSIVRNTYLEIDSADNLYVCFRQESGPTVMKYDGSTWSSLPAPATCGDMKLDRHGMPYVAGWQRVQKFNGSSWIDVGTSGFMDGGYHYEAAYSLAFDADNRPVLGYTSYDWDEENENYKHWPRVERFDGTDWVPIKPYSTEYTDYPLSLIATPSGDIYMAYTMTRRLEVAKRISDGYWVHNTLSSGGSYKPSLVAKPDGTPMSVFLNSGSISVVECNSPFGSIGPRYFSDTPSLYEERLDMAFDATGTPYVAFIDQQHGGKLTVLTYTPGMTTGITGALAMCSSASSTLSNSTRSGTWASSNSAIAAVNSTSGVVTGAAGGTSVITYTVGSCSATAVVTVDASAGLLSGTAAMCVGSAALFTSTVSGGTWSSGSPSVASVGTDGTVTGLSYGSARISYSTGGPCVSTYVVTVDTVIVSAGTLSGASAVCVGAYDIVTASKYGGTWSSSTPSVLTTIGPSGVIHGISVGTATVSYGFTNSCGSIYATRTVTVNGPASAGTLSGGSIVCAGDSVLLSSTVTGGTWASSDTTIARVGAAGMVQGIAAGTVTISYLVSAGCSGGVATHVVTVTAAPSAGTISGGSVICTGSASTLSTSGSGGTWSSSNAGIASVGTGGVVAGIASGEAVMSYTVTNSCGTSYATKSVTVNALADAGVISGPGSVCTGTTISLSTTGADGTWSSGNTSVATVGSGTGVVSGVAMGTAVITYSVANSCGTAYATTIVSVDILSSITGSTGLCIGSTTTLTHPVSGGTWSSSNSGVATVGSTGVVTGVSNGAATITYTASAGCFATLGMTVGLPAITGTTNVCIGSSTALSNTTSGGVWSSAVPYYASVDASTGVVTGAHVGTTTITYSTGGSCYVATTVNVPNIVLNITGGLTLCPGGTSSLSVPGYPGGSWTSESTSVATIHPTYGGMTAVSPGTSTITYTYAYCTKTAVATVNGVPAAITGDSAVCVGSTTSLSCATSGGVWSSSNLAKATVNSSGVLTGVSSGVSTIVYTNGLGCSSTHVVTVGAVPSAISGTTIICTGSNTTLYCGTASGTWSSSATGVADIVSSTGTSAVLSGVSAGAATITFHHAGGCEQTTGVTVTAAPGGISGTLDICIGGSSALSASPGGGTWSSSDYGRVSVNATTGVITGVSTGTSTITYQSASACYTTAVATVGVASDITGAASVCAGLSATLSHSVGGGTWASGSVGIATVNATTGEVTGVSAGTANITYYIGTGCYAVKSIAVYANPPAISGASSLCSGSTITLSNLSGGASTWTSSDGTVASVGSTGIVTGVGAGEADITYTKTATGCYVTKHITVNETPAAISGSNTICVGSDEVYVSSPSGGTWSSTAPAVGSIHAASGIATGRAGGGTIIRYTLASGCQVAKAITVTVLPGGITGANVLCMGNSVVLTAATSGSTWSSTGGSLSVSPLGANTATVVGVSTGAGTISYTNAAGCGRVYVMTVNAAVAAIGGEDIVCSGGTVTLTNTTGGGTWSSNATAKVGIGTYTGIATGGSAVGTATITYRTGAGCYATKTMTNNAALPNIVGATYTCSGASGAVTFTNGVSGGTWSSSNTGVATVDAASGLVTGVLLGGSNTYVYITYATSAGCSKSKAILIKPQPIISGASDVAVGGTTSLSGSPTGGEWSSSSTAVAYISGYGVVAGMATGSATITYTSAGCTNIHGMSVTGGSLARPGIEVETGGVKFSVYPNPTHGALNVSTEVAGTFGIYTVDGKLVSESPMVPGVNSVLMPSDLAEGIYVCRFVCADGSVQVVRVVYY